MLFLFLFFFFLLFFSPPSPPFPPAHIHHKPASLMMRKFPKLSPARTSWVVVVVVAGHFKGVNRTIANPSPVDSLTQQMFWKRVRESPHVIPAALENRL